MYWILQPHLQYVPISRCTSNEGWLQSIADGHSYSHKARADQVKTHFWFHHISYHYFNIHPPHFPDREGFRWSRARGSVSWMLTGRVSRKLTYAGLDRGWALFFYHLRCLQYKELSPVSGVVSLPGPNAGILYAYVCTPQQCDCRLEAPSGLMTSSY